MAKGKKKGRQQAESSDDEPKQSMAAPANESDEQLNAAQPAKAAKKKDKKKSKKKTDVASDADSDLDLLKHKKQNDEDSEDEMVVVTKSKSKKDKKKSKKKVDMASDDDESDLDPLKQKRQNDEDSEDEMVPAMKSKSKKDKRKKGGFAALADDDSDEDEVAISKPKSGFSALIEDGDHSDGEDSPPKPSAKTGFAALADSDDDDASVVKPEDYPDSDDNQKKKKEKKTKEKKGKKGKKIEEAAEEEDLDKLLADMNIEIKEVVKKDKKKKKKKDAKTQDEETTQPEEAVEKEDVVPAEAAAPAAPAPPTDVKEEGEETAATDDKKKKKKKKKKDEKESTPGDGEDIEAADPKPVKGGKKPTKAILQMQEALRKREEEAKRLEEKAREDELRAEEAERLRVQKIIEEKERVELKKQREKEKREKLKAEGKLLTKAQKQAQARALATLQALREQGVNIPGEGERPKRANLIRRKKKTTTAPEEESPPKQETEEKVSESKDELVTPSTTESLPSAEKKADDSEEDVRDAWDQTSESEAEPAKSELQPEKPQTAEKSKADPKKPSEKESSEEEDESSDDEEDGSSEEESSEEEEESSEEEESDDEETDKHERLRHKVLERIRKRREANEKKRTTDNLRSPVICVLGHVDTGKTKILDYIRRTHVQDNEAGGITQQIGATMVPLDAIKEQCKAVKDFSSKQLRIPGALIIDTPGHESFSNLRSRGSSLCDMAILVVDIMHGLEPQTIESINLLKAKRTPFVVALNKIDRLYEWKSNKHKDVSDVLANQALHTKQEFDEHTGQIIAQFAEQGLNAALFNNNPDPKTFISLVPTSAFTGDGMGNLISLVVELTQKMLAHRIAYSEELQATVLEVKAIPGLGTTIDVIVVNGELKEGDTMVLAGHEGPFITQIRSLLMPQPLRELRVKNAYQEFKAIKGAQGVKIAAKDLDKAIAGLNVLVARSNDEIEFLKEEIARSLKEVMGSFKLHDKGVYVQASTLGSLEALLVFLRDSKIPYFGIRIGPVVKKDVIKASVMLEHDSQYAVILAFDVKVERDAQELADHSGVKIFSADIIYHLFDKFTAHREELRQKKREEFKGIATFPCKLRILPQFVFKSRDPIVVGVMVEAGVVKLGTPLCVPSRDFLNLGSVSSIEVNHKAQEMARKGEEVCIRIENTTSEAPKLYGRHFEYTDMLCSRITRESIDACKEHFRTDLSKQDWQLMIELKKVFQIL